MEEEDTRAVTAKAKGKGKGKAKCKPKGKAKARARAKAQASPTIDPQHCPISPPFKLTYRWKPSHNAQCYMSGTIQGTEDRIVTNMSVNMSHNYTVLMGRVHAEAVAGKFPTKGDAVRRRDELLAEERAVTADANNEHAAGDAALKVEGTDIH